MKPYTGPIKPLTGAAYLKYLKQCVLTVAAWPKWVAGRGAK